VIVADTNLISYLLLNGPESATARNVFLRDPEWAAPLLWRSEFRNVLVVYARRRKLGIEEAERHFLGAEKLVAGREHLVDAGRVLCLALSSSCSAYDCEFVALARELGVPLVTGDARVLKEFPRVAVGMKEFGEDSL
jgi:predicted nucleic acid-binding protein